MKFWPLFRGLAAAPFNGGWYPLTYAKLCPVCGSQLVSRIEHENHAQVRAIQCPKCERCTVDDPHIPDNDNPPMHVTPHHPNWVKCPHCRWNFPLESPYWNGERHEQCGQRLVIDEAKPE